MTQQPTGHDLARQAAADGHRANAAHDLRSLIRDIPLLEQLAHGRVRGLGFASDRELAEQGRRHVEERRQRRALEIASDGDAGGYGPTANPGNLNAIDALVQIDSGLTRLGTRIHALGQAGNTRDLIGATTLGRAQHIDDLIHEITSPALLRHAAETTARLAEHATRTLDGNDRHKLDSPCPWCGHHGLVITFNDGVATCTGSHPCTCSTPDCDCHRNPTGFRHTWARDRGARAGSWWALVDLINLDQRLQEDHVIAQQLLDVVDQLHTPHFTHEEDGRLTSYRSLPGQETPEGHVCRLIRPAGDVSDDPRYLDEDDPQAYATCILDGKARGLVDDFHTVPHCVTCHRPFPCDTHRQAHALYEAELDHIERTRGHRWRTILTGSSRTRTRTPRAGRSS